MSIGMTYQEFWYGDPYLVQYYKKANDYRLIQMNTELWLQGAYFQNALSVVMSNAFDKNSSAKYPSEPYDVIKRPKSHREVQTEKERQKVIEYFTQMKKNWDIHHKE